MVLCSFGDACYITSNAVISLKLQPHLCSVGVTGAVTRLPCDACFVVCNIVCSLTLQRF